MDFDDAVARLEARIPRRREQLDPATRPRPDLPVGTDLLPRIRHIVVLMMENHSFDNYLGMLGRGDGLTGAESNPGPDGEPVAVHHLTSTGQVAGVPSQSWAASHRQWNGGAMDGFANSAAEQPGEWGGTGVGSGGTGDDSAGDDSAGDDRASGGTGTDYKGGGPALAMGHWTGDDLPFYADLAATFPLCDRWFSSCMGPTFPNRRFLVAGTANGLASDNLLETIDFPPHGTVLDLLSDHGITWGNYHSAAHSRPVLERLGGRGTLRAARRLGSRARGALADLRAMENEAKTYLQFTANAYPLGLLGYVGHVWSVRRFLRQAAAGTLPAFSIVDPDFRANSEENPQDVRLGEAFSSRVIEAVLHGAGWPGTLLVWLYDEHGGYYDHVPPPPAVPPDGVRPGPGGPWGFDRYGFRVPAVVVSPYARPGYVSSVVRDHTSILRLVETKWNLPALTARDAASDDLLDCVDLESPPPFLRPPSLSRPALDR
ncbi:MAG: alkaline phosphatase family protein [Acidimicrobiales bacterium]